MKLAQLQEARYHRSPVVRHVYDTAKKLVDEDKEEYGIDINEKDIPQIIRDMDGEFERDAVDVDPEAPCWLIPVPTGYDSIQINAAIFPEFEPPALVVYLY